ncbi:MAG: glycosyltransferase family 2 protein [Candidatus Nanopelagicales bacterium]|nr:glycosyltransferase family 2 protein [Candidatus Nanopelagicales bacterium]
MSEIGFEPEPALGGDPQWFDEDVSYDFDEEPISEPVIARSHFVTTVLVSHNGATWLPAVLTQLARTTRPPEVIVGVDARSTDTSLEILTQSLGADRVVALAQNQGFGACVDAGLGLVPRPDFRADARLADTIEWIWLLHDDCAPDSTALEQLLLAADRHPSVAVLGPKILGWHDRRLLLEVGVGITSDGRRVTGLERGEHDQGQHDGERDVLAVSSAGMLVRRDIFDALGGFDPELPLFRDDLDLCWRAHRMGERVIIATGAQMHHREASAHGRRLDNQSRLESSRLLRADREAAVHVLLAHSSGVAAVLIGLRLFLGSVIRSLGYLLGKDASAAGAEIGAVVSVILHPSRLRRSRALVAVTSTEPASVVRHLRPSTWEQIRSLGEAAAGLATTSGSTTNTLSALDSGPVDEDASYLEESSAGLFKRVLRKPSVAIIVLLTLIAAAATRSLWLGEGVIQGGALLPSPWGASDLWNFYFQGWHNVGPGSVSDSPPYLAVIAVLSTITLGKATLAVNFMLLLAIPLAGWAAYFASRVLIPSKAIRFWGAATYALLPAMTGSLAQGRLGTSFAAFILPFALRSGVRMLTPDSTRRRAAGTALLFALLLAFAPALWLISLVCAVLAIAFIRRTKEAVIKAAITFGASFAALVPWSFSLALNPVQFFFEPGLNSATLTDPDISMVDIFLLHPGGPGMSPIVITIGIVLAAVLALARTDRRSVAVLLIIAAWVGILFALVQVVFLFTPAGATTQMRTWPGPATLFIGLMLIAAAALGAQGLRTRFIGQSFSLGQPIAAIAVLAALAAPLLSLLWLIPADTSVLARNSPATVPAFVAADAFGPQAPRTLMLTQLPAGNIEYTLINGDGLRLGDADTPPSSQVWRTIDPYVAALASGRGGDEVAALGGYGVRYVALATGSSKEIVPILDAEPGLRRLSNSDGEVLWRVSGVTSRARITDGDIQSPVGIASPEDLGTQPYIEQILPDGTGTRVLYIGAGADSRWKAGDLGSVATEGVLDWSATFEIPAGSPEVRVVFDNSSRQMWLLAQLFIVLSLIVIALPSRRGIEVDPDLDISPDITHMNDNAQPIQGRD